MEFLSDRVSVERGPGSVSVVISPRLPRWQESLLVVWCVAWLLCGGYIAYSIAHMPSGPMRSFFFVFLAFWTYFAVKSIHATLWRLRGFEMIRVKDGVLTIKDSILGFGKARDHHVENIREFGTLQVDEHSWKWQMNAAAWVVGGERLGFAHFSKRVVFGKGLTGPEADAIARELQRALSSAREQAQ